jgi:hypothetical protein
MAKEKTNEGIVDLREKTTVYATEKSRYHKAGEPIVTHPLLAAKLIKAGKATEKAQK